MFKLLCLSASVFLVFTSQLTLASEERTILCNSGNVIGVPSVKIEVAQDEITAQKWQTSGYSNSDGAWHPLTLKAMDEGDCENCYTLKWNFMSYRGANRPQVKVDVKYVIQEDSTGLIAYEWRRGADEASWWRNGSISRPDRCLVF